MERNGIEQQQPLTIQLLTDENGDNVNGDSAITLLLLFSVFIAVCGSFTCGCALGYSSPVQSAIMEELNLSTAQFSLFGSMLTAGALFGSVVCGKITDLIGRRVAMGLADFLSITGWIAISISQEAWSLDLGRFFIGVSQGLLYYVVPVYIAEITPKSIRGGLVALSTLMISCGVVVMFIAGSMIPWRILVLIGIIPSSVQLLGIFVIPEPPRFLEFTEHHSQQILKVNIVGVFQRKYAHSVAVAFGLMALSALGSPTGVTCYASSIFESAGFSTTIGSIVLAAVQVPSAVIVVYTIDKCGRVPLMLLSAAAMFFCCLLVGIMFLLKQNDYLENVCTYLIALGLWGYSAAFRLGMAGIPYVIMSEIFPMEVKGSAGSLSVLVSCVCYWIVSYAFNFLAEWSYSGAFFVFAGINAFAVLFTAWFVPETKGRALEDIQESL